MFFMNMQSTYALTAVDFIVAVVAVNHAVTAPLGPDALSVIATAVLVILARELRTRFARTHQATADTRAANRQKETLRKISVYT